MTRMSLRGDAAIVDVLKLRGGRGKLSWAVVCAAAAMALLAPGRFFVTPESGQSCSDVEMQGTTMAMRLD